MRLLAASGSNLSAGTLIAVAAFSALVLRGGVRHYRGRNRWVMRWLPSEAAYFGTAWFGAAGLLMVLCALAAKVSVVLEAIVAVPALAVLAIAIVSTFWLPARLLPGWYLAEARTRARHRTPSA